jgi:protein ImuA
LIAAMSEKLAALVQRIAAIERQTTGRAERLPAVPLGCAAIDGVLPGGGLARGAVHEFMGPGHESDQRGDGALMGFGAVALARLLAADEGRRPALWCMNHRLQQVGGLLSGQVYPPGLQAMGVPLDRLLLAYTNNDADTLWAMEEALRSGAVAAVLGELTRFEPGAARRLQLAAQEHGGTGLALWPGRGLNAASFAETRWRLTSLPSTGRAIVPHWHVTLLRARRSAVIGDWSVRWHDGRLEAAAYLDMGCQPDAGQSSAVRRA